MLVSTHCKKKIHRLSNNSRNTDFFKAWGDIIHLLKQIKIISLNMYNSV